MRLNTEVWGDGPRTAGLVHGLGRSGELWRDFAEPLVTSGEWTVRAVDLRGHGGSGRADSYLVADFAADLVESFPPGLDLLAGHSLGGSVLAAAVGALAPGRVLYLDPGFELGLPTEGLRARLFWAAPLVGLSLVALGRRKQARQAEAARSPANRERSARAARAFDKKMISEVYRDIAFHPHVPVAPEMPTTVVLSDEGDAVVPPGTADELTGLGWDVRRLPGVGHDFWLENAAETNASVADLR